MKETIQEKIDRNKKEDLAEMHHYIYELKILEKKTKIKLGIDWDKAINRTLRAISEIYKKRKNKKCDN
ncbi:MULTISPECIES: hypothetical protein [unclassified Gemella]|uniref:hypothetical protein n=1 Tax=unclassified Gemella TaxID=2624949 RepID=UPI001C049358|nr:MULTISPECIES: hypothetical protein [unclassified Gemella]MBU0279201.1 hypothetical protein [Gemella sp. zg-1178]QWQ38328.1 hypothetical protein KMP11_05035 [Gemella sp. zg-570]QWQ39265.1 hypothetical protein KMP11_02775 [Gemella sp. zg-570]